MLVTPLEPIKIPVISGEYPKTYELTILLLLLLLLLLLAIIPPVILPAPPLIVPDV